MCGIVGSVYDGMVKKKLMQLVVDLMFLFILLNPARNGPNSSIFFPQLILPLLSQKENKNYLNELIGPLDTFGFTACEFFVPFFFSFLLLCFISFYSVSLWKIMKWEPLSLPFFFVYERQFFMLSRCLRSDA